MVPARPRLLRTMKSRTLGLLLCTLFVSSQAAALQQHRVVVPSSDGAANDVRPLITWTPVQPITSYRVRLYSDPTLQTLVDEQTIVGQVNLTVGTNLADRQAYYIDIQATTPGSGIFSFPVSRFRVVLVPSWMPRFFLWIHDPALSQGDYRLVDLMDMQVPAGGKRIPAMLLINVYGEIVWFYRAPGEGFLMAPKVLPSGNLLYLVQGTVPGTVTVSPAYEMTWQGQIVWTTDPSVVLHHDVVLGPGQTYAAVNHVWKTVAGVSYDGDGITLFNRNTGQIVWQWDIFDHFPPEDYWTSETDFLSLTGVGQDWTHSNAVVWDKGRNLLWLSVRHFDSLIGIDYPSGNVRVVLGELGIGGESLMSHQHAPELQSDGKILLYDNGNTYTPPFTRTILFDFDAVQKTASIVWEWRDTPDFFDFAVGDADALPNGNVLITAGISTRMVEVTQSKQIVWDMYMIPNGRWWFYRSHYIPTALIDPSVLPF